MYKYSGSISFESDHHLTTEQLDQIVFALEVQIEEPVDAEGNDVEFLTGEVLISLSPTYETKRKERFKKMMGQEINCWTWNFHSALDYVATIITSGKVVLTFDTDTEKVAKGFDTTDHKGEDIFGLFELFLAFTSSELDFDRLGIHEDALSMHDLEEEDIIEMFKGNPVEVARVLRDAQKEFKPTYTTKENN
jgi:hypothetical protein